MIQRLNPATLPQPSGNYTHGTLVTGTSHLLFVSELASEPMSQGDRERRHRACEGAS